MTQLFVALTTFFVEKELYPVRIMNKISSKLILNTHITPCQPTWHVFCLRDYIKSSRKQR